MGNAANPFSKPDARREWLNDQAREESQKAVEKANAGDADGARLHQDASNEAAKNASALGQQLSEARSR